MQNANVGSRMKQALAETGMTSAALANRLGVSPPLVSLWLKGTRSPSREQVRAAAAALKVDAAWLEGAIAAGSAAPAEAPAAWFFRRQPDDGGRDYGNANVFATPPDLGTLVRETGQNSLDAALGAGPVTLRFSVRQLRRGSAEFDRFLESLRFDELSAHITAAAETESKLGTRLRGGMERLHARQSLVLLRIDDYGTTGLFGSERTSDTSSPFAALVRNNLDSSKRTTTAGGSFGVGKAVLWRCSDFSTVLFASKIAAGFEGATDTDSYRVVAKTELTWHKVTDVEFAGPGWMGAPDTNGESILLSAEQLVPLQMDRADLPSGVDANRDSGSSVMIVGFTDPELAAAADCNELAERIAGEAARNFWPAIQRNRLRVIVDAYRDADLIRTIVVPEGPHVPELRDSLQRHDNQEVVDELSDPGDVVRVEIPIAIPAVRQGAKGLQAFDELTSAAFLLVRLAGGEDLKSSELNSVALVRGRGMVVKYWKRQNLVVGAQPFHAILLVGEFAASEPPQIAAEQFFRLSEPPAHDEWRFTEDLKEKYERGAKARLDAIFHQVDAALRSVIMPPVKAADDGPAELRRLLQLNVSPPPARPPATIRNVNETIEDGRWVIEGDIHVNDREAIWAISPRLWLRTEDGAGIRVKWAELHEIPTPVLAQRDYEFLTSAQTKRFRFRAVSEVETDGIRVNRCKADLDLAVTKQES